MAWADRVRPGEPHMRDLVRLPITVSGKHENPVGYVMIEATILKTIEPFVESWGLGFISDYQTGKVKGFDIYPHQAEEGS